MRKRLNAWVGACLMALFTASVAAGPGHDHGSHSHDPVNAQQAKGIAQKIVNKLVSLKKLPESWKSVPAPDAETKMFSGKKEWVVTFNNAQIKDTSKQQLYIFLTINGDYLAANFTGN